MARLIGATTALLLLLAGSALATGPPPAPWGQVGGNPQGTGQSSNIGPSAGALKWAAATGKRVPGFEDAASRVHFGVHGVVVSASSDVFFGSHDGFIYAVSGATGAPLWNFNAYSPIDAPIAIGRSPLSSVEDTIYAGNANGTLYALNMTDGSVLWTFNTKSVTGSTYTGSPVVVPNSNMVLLVSGKYILAITSGGQLEWQGPSACAGTYGISTPSLSQDLSLFYFTCSYPGFEMFSGFVSNGTQTSTTFVINKWPNANRPVVLSDDSIAVVANDVNGEAINVFDPDGSMKWVYNWRYCYPSSTLTVDSAGNFYVPTCDAMLKLAANGSTILWSTPIDGGYSCSSPSMDAGE